MNAWLIALGRDAVDTITDVVGIVAVVTALTLLVVVETRRSSGRPGSKILNRSAIGVTVLALAIIGGRFQWIPAASDAERSAETAASLQDDAEATSSTTAPDDGEREPDASTTSAGPVSTEVGPPTPSSDPAPPEPAPTLPDEDPDVVAPSTTAGPPTPTTDGDDVGDEPETPVVDDEAEGPADPRGPPASTYEVVAGDNFWTIAESVLESETGGPVSDGEIHGYWLTLIDANADQLVEPGNPDLILPGQMLDLPPVGGASP